MGWWCVRDLCDDGDSEGRRHYVNAHVIKDQQRFSILWFFVL